MLIFVEQESKNSRIHLEPVGLGAFNGTSVDILTIISSDTLAHKVTASGKGNKSATIGVTTTNATLDNPNSSAPIDDRVSAQDTIATNSSQVANHEVFHLILMFFRGQCQYRNVIMHYRNYKDTLSLSWTVLLRRNNVHTAGGDD